MTFEVKLLITFVATDPLIILTKFGWNPIKHAGEEANCEKKERKKERKKSQLETAPLLRARGKVRRYVKRMLYNLRYKNKSLIGHKSPRMQFHAIN